MTTERQKFIKLLDELDLVSSLDDSIGVYELKQALLELYDNAVPSESEILILAEAIRKKNE